MTIPEDFNELDKFDGITATCRDSWTEVGSFHKLSQSQTDISEITLTMTKALTVINKHFNSLLLMIFCKQQNVIIFGHSFMHVMTFLKL